MATKSIDKHKMYFSKEAAQQKAACEKNWCFIKDAKVVAGKLVIGKETTKVCFVQVTRKGA